MLKQALSYGGGGGWGPGGAIFLPPKAIFLDRLLLLFRLVSKFVVIACCEDGDLQKYGQPPLLQWKMQLMKSLTVGICGVHTNFRDFMRVVS